MSLIKEMRALLAEPELTEASEIRASELPKAEKAALPGFRWVEP